jgi:hypothetical protein
MAICRIIETGATPDQYEQVRARVGLGDEVPPGGVLHIAAKGDDGMLRVIEVWESRDMAEEFTKKVMAAREELGIATGRPPIQYLEVHRLAQNVGSPA